MDRSRRKARRNRRGHGLGLSLTSFALLFFVAVPAQAEPCGDVSLEGQCADNVRTYCNADELKTETCESCCGWNGKEFECLDVCPADGECIEECLGGTDVFGCSLMNTHEWTCVIGADGCTDRVYVTCGEGQICDEAVSHKCTPIEQVDLCGGIPASGICSSGVFKKCVNNQVESTDCSANGQTCLVGQGCSSDCSVDCLDGEAGCNPDGKAWICTENPITGCFEKAAKSCGAKVCHEGVCYFLKDVPKDDDPTAEPEAVEASDSPTAPEEESESASSGGCVYLGNDHSVGEATLITLVTLLGVVLLLAIARRREGEVSPKVERARRSSKRSAE